MLVVLPLQFEQHQVGALRAADQPEDVQAGVSGGGVEVAEPHLHAVVLQVRDAGESTHTVRGCLTHTHRQGTVSQRQGTVSHTDRQGTVSQTVWGLSHSVKGLSHSVRGLSHTQTVRGLSHRPSGAVSQHQGLSHSIRGCLTASGDCLTASGTVSQTVWGLSHCCLHSFTLHLGRLADSFIQSDLQ